MRHDIMVYSCIRQLGKANKNNQKQTANQSGVLV